MVVFDAIKEPGCGLRGISQSSRAVLGLRAIILLTRYARVQKFPQYQ